MSLRPTGFNEASRMSRNSFGFKSLHTNSAQHVRAADKFRRPDKAVFLRHKYANGGALGTLFLQTTLARGLDRPLGDCRRALRKQGR